MTVTGQDLLDFALTRQGDDYIYGSDVPLDDPDYHGPWDCAEFVSWAVYQQTKQIYGCLPSNHNPLSTLDPWTGAWHRDAHNGAVQKISVDKAKGIPGAILLVFNGLHHIVFSVGDGRTFGAQNHRTGVDYADADWINWSHGILIPGVDYGLDAT